MEGPLVSVIIPNYNHSKFLIQRINSVINQTYRNLEIIILDDCSTDSSRQVIEEFRNNPLVKKIIFNDKNSGNPFKQWKTGIDLAMGEWVWIAESDDYAELNFLEKMISFLGAKKNVGLIYCDSVIVDNENRGETFSEIKNKRFNTNRWSENYENSGVNEIEDYLLPGGTINNTSAVLFNKEVLIRENPFDLDLRYIGDKYAFIKVLSGTNVLYIKDKLNHYRNPFSQKHADRYILYFYEQFKVFNWVYRNMKISDKQKYLKGFYANTRNSLFTGWNGAKVRIYKKLFALNTYLMLKNVLYNLTQPILSRIISKDY